VHRLALILILLPLAGAHAAGKGGDFDGCEKGQTEVAKQAADFHGEARIKQLIDADLQRSEKELNEGDADECIEALDHARKLIAGQY
jgi:hypothetical protein